MEPKHELLLFSKKEIFFIVVLLVFVSLLSFTFGLQMGKRLGLAETGRPVLHEESTPHLNEYVPEAESSHGEAPVKQNTELNTHSSQSDSDTDPLKSEIKKSQLKSDQKVITELPGTKKKETDKIGYTLQVGSHKTIEEAAEQVALLKRQGLEKSFYFEAEVPAKGVWYRVGIGVYKTKNDAEQAGADLKKDPQAPSFIVLKMGEG